MPIGQVLDNFILSVFQSSSDFKNSFITNVLVRLNLRSYQV